MSVSHLQYVDATVFFGEATVANLWTIKAILRGFELASSLKVNFGKRLPCLSPTLAFQWGLMLESCLLGNLLLTQSQGSWGLGIIGDSYGEDLAVRRRYHGLVGQIFANLRLVNNALLAKWRWRILTEGQGLWCDILLARYGSLFPAPHFAGCPNGFRGVSLWWSDVSLLGTRVISHSDWFFEGVTKRVGNGTTTSFWFDTWVDSVPLRVRYQSLFQASDQCPDRVVDMGASFVYGRSMVLEARDRWVVFGVGCRVRLGFILVWHAVVWTIATSRNDIIFAGGSSAIDNIVDRVKLSSWKWFLGKNPDSPCSIYEWEVQPLLCWSSKVR
ncbi:hypothetical protein TSUD_351650 [Trifolium subterraneum]|uniref:Reverse transcriptase zinc-binding domain-containing protein n=1 Tax=Trifolium subterraneum TaxID=3900 RepID=A0A2Z6PFA1_TRISU|nr:hypothetical protein TSUD_351650 [Trifolium subterraneum]